MTRLAFALISFALVACAAPKPPPNKAIAFVNAVTDDAMTCVGFKPRTPGEADTALCVSDRVLMFCAAGGDGKVRGCEHVMNLNPKKKSEQPQPGPQPSPDPQPAASSPPPGETKPAAEPTKTADAKPDAKPSDKPKAEPAKPPGAGKK